MQCELQHHGILGMKWGVRRYQNEDGTLTAAGRKRYGDQIGWEAKQMYKRGTISKDEYKKRIQPMTKRARIDNYELLGQGRKLREGIERNKRGIRAASIPVGAFVGATAFAQLQKMMRVKPGTKEAVASILLGAIGGMTLGAISTETELLNNRSRLSDYDYKSPYKKRTPNSKTNLANGAAIGVGAIAGLAALPGAASVLTKAPHIVPENSLPKLVAKGEALVQGLGLIDIK